MLQSDWPIFVVDNSTSNTACINWLSVVCNLIGSDVCHHSAQNFLLTHLTGLHESAANVDHCDNE